MANGVQIGALHISLSADSAAFNRGMDNAQATAEEAMSTIGDQAKKLAGVLAGLFAVDLIKDRIKEQIDYADSLADVAARAHQTAEALSAMEYALHFSDATLQDYTGGLQKLSENMAAAASGNKQQAELFDALGIKIRDQQGHMRAASDVMMDFADVLSKMDAGVTRNSLSVQELGKSLGPQLLPFLSQGSAAIKDLTDEARKFNLVVSTEASDAAGQINDSLDKLQFAATGAWRTIAVQLSPALGQISENMLQTAQSSGALEAAAQGLAIGLKVIYTGAMATYQAIAGVGDGIGKLAAVAVSVGQGDFARAREIWNDNTGAERTKANILAIGDLWSDTGKKAANAANAQAGAVDQAKNTLDLEAKLAAQREKDSKSKDKNKDNFEYGGLRLAEAEYQGVVNQENLANQMFMLNEQAAVAAFGDTIDAMLVEMDAAKTIAEAEWSDLIDSELSRIDSANAYKMQAQADFAAGFLTLDRERIAGVITNGDAELEARKAQMAATVDFFHQGLASMAAGQGKAAKAAQAIQKAQALYEIGVNTYRAAMGAYAALAPIPVVGPALGVAAAAAAITFGASMAQGVISGGKPTAVGGDVSALPASSSPASQADQRAAEVPQITYFRVEEDAILTGRKLIDLINDASSDGKEMQNIRFIPA